jgi:hypothetical protein
VGPARLTDYIVEITSPGHSVGRVLVQGSEVGSQIPLGFDSHILLSSEEYNALLSDEKRTADQGHFPTEVIGHNSQVVLLIIVQVP